MIEIDGSQHRTNEGKVRDKFRTEILEGYDLKIIRFTNQQVQNEFYNICEYIDEVTQMLLKEEAER